jgi:NADH-quinone oxidoreductase E subunit
MYKQPVLPFKGTKMQETKLMESIQKNKDERGALMPVLQDAQEIYGYLPIEVQTMVAEGLDLSLSEVYGVATFYSQFSLNPKGEHQISVCMGTACYVKGADKILEALQEKLGIGVGECTPDGLFSLDSTRCVGACGLAPVMMVDNDVYGKMTVAQIDDILEKYRQKYKPTKKNRE